MISKYSHQFNRPITIIYPGEYFVSTESAVIGTLLGTCVSACLFDEINNVYGMNHFLLPYNSKHEKNNFLDQNALFGISSMEFLINAMLKKGASKPKIRAKVFGAGSILNDSELSKVVVNNNITFVKEYLQAENIPIISEDLGGQHGRKIFFFTEKSGKVLLKRILNEKIEFKINVEEKHYKAEVIKHEKEKNNEKVFRTNIIFGDDL